MSNVEASTKRSKTKGIWIIPAIILLFGLPYLVSYWWFFIGDVPEAPTNNRGVLLQEKLIFPVSNLVGLTDKVTGFEALKGKWVLVTFADGACEERCIETLIQMRQVRLAMGIDRSRVERLWVVPARYDAVVLAPVIESFRALQVGIDANNELQVLRNQLRERVGLLLNSVFIVDPRGHVILGYPAPANPKDVLKDLQKLLKVSTIG